MYGIDAAALFWALKREMFGLCLWQELGLERRGLSKFVGESTWSSEKSGSRSLRTLLCVLTGMRSWHLPAFQTLLHRFQASFQFEWLNGVQMGKNQLALFLNKFKCQTDQVLHFFWVFFCPLKNVWVIGDIYNAVGVYKSKRRVRITVVPRAGALYNHLI